MRPPIDSRCVRVATKRPAFLATLLALLLNFISFGLSGCGASDVPTVGSITMAVGSSSTVAPGGVLSLSATVGNDLKGLGVNWSASCTPINSITVVTSATSTACGTFSPTHTASGAFTTYTAPVTVPTNGTVTITATSVTDPSQSSSMTITISGQPLTVTIAPATANVEVAGNGMFTATVANDPANAGVTWSISCGLTPPQCGEFDPTLLTQTEVLSSGTPITYYAPAGLLSTVVTLTATSVTNPTISATSTVTIVPAIVVSFAPPVPTSLTPSTPTSLTAIVQNDSANGGVTWSVTCAAAASGGSCGTFSPVQTASGVSTSYTAPGGSSVTAVTITATSVTDPTKFVSLTLSSTILIGISGAISSLPPGGTAPFSATVLGDPANAGVTWSATAGTFSSTHTGSGDATTYTAPATIPSSGTVTITATSVTNTQVSATATVQVIAPLTVTVVPASVTLQTGNTAGFLAIVTGDSANAGVNWTATGGGSFSQTPTASNVATIYTAPTTAGTVTVTATSAANPAISGTATVTVTTTAQPISITVTPQTASVPEGQTATFQALLANDSTNAGVTWSTAGGGTVNPAQTGNGVVTTFTAPNGAGTVILTATSAATTSISSSATITVTQPSYTALLSGQYAIQMTGVAKQGSGLDGDYESYVGSLTLDGNGNVTAGEVDFTSQALANNGTEAQPWTYVPSVTGTYTIGADGHGTITLTNPTFQGPGGTIGYNESLSVTVVSSSPGRALISTTDLQPTLEVLSGTMDQQTPSVTLSQLNGNYAFTFLQPYTLINEPQNEGGVLTISQGTIKNYLIDQNQGTNNIIATDQSIAANDAFGAPDSFGRGTVNLSQFPGAGAPPYSYVYYIVDSTHIILQSEYAGGLAAVYQQSATAPTSLAGTYAFTERGFVPPGAPDWVDAGGIFTCNSDGTISGTLDVNDATTFTSSSVTGTCALDSTPDGRGTITFNGGTSPVSSFAVYPTANNGLLMMELDQNAAGVGVAYTQSANVLATTFNGPYAGNVESFFQTDAAEVLNGVFGAAGTTALTGTFDLATFDGETSGVSLTNGSPLTDTTGGRLTGSISTTASGNLQEVFYVVSPNLTLSLESDNQNIGTGIFQLQTFPGAGQTSNPISVSVSPATTNPPLTLTTGQTQTFTATVTNDSSATPSVNWTATCAAGGTSCGSFSPTQTATGVQTTYTAPASVTGSSVNITITATSVTNPQISQNVVVTVTAPSTAPGVTITSSPQTVFIGQTGSFTATVVNSTADVAWTATAGTFSPAQTASGVVTTYTPPSTAGSVTITATLVGSSPAVTATASVTVSAPTSQSVLNGQFAFAMSGVDAANNSLYETVVGSLTTHGDGTVTSGELDYFAVNTNTNVQGLTGNYTLDSTGHGTILLNDTAGNSYSFYVTMVNQGHGLISVNSFTGPGIQEAPIVSGTLDQQIPGAAPSVLNGNYAFTYEQPNANTTSPVNLGGVMTITSGTTTSSVTSYLLDENLSPSDTSILQQVFTGTNDAFTPSQIPVVVNNQTVQETDPSGRGLITFLGAPPFADTGSNNFIYYLVDATHVIIEGTKEAGLAHLYLQPGVPPSSIAGNYAFTTRGYAPTSGVDTIFAGGVFTCNSDNSMTGTLDVNDSPNGSTSSYTSGSISGTCVLDSPADGRGTITITTPSGGIDGITTYTVYPTANHGLLMFDTDTVIPAVGTAYPQAANLSSTSFAQTYAADVQSIDDNLNILIQNGTLTATPPLSTGALTGTVDTSSEISDAQSSTVGVHIALTNNSALSEPAPSNGRITGDIFLSATNNTVSPPVSFSFNASDDLSENFYVVDANTVLTLETDNNDTGTGILQLQTLSQGVMQVAVAPTTASLAAGATQAFTATITNGGSNAQVAWTLSCTAGGSACGSLSTTTGGTTTYTAPGSSATVGITATLVSNPTITSTAVVTVAPGPNQTAVSLSVPTPSSTVLEGQQVSITATVANGGANPQVNWTASRTGGTFSSSTTASGVSTTYTAPSTKGAVTITATLAGVTPPVFATTQIQVNAPIAVTVHAATANVPVGLTDNITAVVSNDSADGGVTWSATCAAGAGACGSFSTSQEPVTGTFTTTFTAPSTAESVTITATANDDTTKSAQVTVTVLTPTVLYGQYAFTLRGYTSSNTYQTYEGSLTADGAGNITAFELDTTNSNGTKTYSTPSSGSAGTYTVDATTGMGTITLQNTSSNFTLPMYVSMVDNSRGLLINNSTSQTLNGTLDLQTPADLANPPNGTFAFTYLQKNGSPSAPQIEGGVLTINDGTIETYVATDRNNGSSITSSTASVPGSTTTGIDTFTAPDSNGRGTITFSNFLGASDVAYVYYMVDSTHFVVQSESVGGLGQFYQQPSTVPAIDGNSYAFTTRGYSKVGSTYAADYLDAGGVLVCDSSGNLTGPVDVTNASSSSATYTSGAITAGTCSLDSPSDGRGTMSITSAAITIPSSTTSTNVGGISKFAVYPATAKINTSGTTENILLMVDLDTAAPGAGIAYQQTSPVSITDFSGNYASNLESEAPTVTYYTIDGQLKLTGSPLELSGTVNAAANLNSGLGSNVPVTNHNPFNDTGNGRITGDVNGVWNNTVPNSGTTADLPEVFYVIDANTVLALEVNTSSDHGYDTGIGILQLQNLTPP